MDNNDSVADNGSASGASRHAVLMVAADPDSIANVCEGATRPARSKSPRSSAEERLCLPVPRQRALR